MGTQLVSACMPAVVHSRAAAKFCQRTPEMVWAAVEPRETVRLSTGSNVGGAVVARKSLWGEN